MGGRLRAAAGSGGRAAGGSLNPPPSAGPGRAQDPDKPGPDKPGPDKPGRSRPGPQRRSTARRDLARHPQFAQVSPGVGELDETALGVAMSNDPDAALALLAQLVTATDEGLRAAARRLASRVVLDRCQRGAALTRGTGKPRPVPADRGGDLDLDASADALLGSLAERRTPALDELVARDWGRPELALCLLLDRSGSMTGDRLATAALATAACALRSPAEHAVLAFAREVTVLRPLLDARPPADVVDAVLHLRGHGTTGLAGALRAATDQLAGSRATRRITVLLSDCEATDGEDPLPAARAVEELVVLAPADGAETAEALVRAAGGRWAALPGADALPGVLAALLD